MKMKIVAVLCIGFLQSGWMNETKRASKTVEDGVVLAIEKQDFAFIAQEVQKEFLNNFHNYQIGSLEQKVKFGIKVSINDILFSADFFNFQIIPRANDIQVKTEVRNLGIFIPVIHAQKKVIFNISATCNNTRIGIARNMPLHLNAFLKPNLTPDHQLILEPTQVDFAIPPDSYQVYGPTSCSGPGFIESIIKNVVHSVIVKARGTIENAMRDQIVNTSRGLGGFLNAVVHQKVAISAFPFSFLSELKGFLKTTPRDLHLSSSGLIVGFNFEATQEKDLLEANTMEEFALEPLHKFGTFKLKQEIFSEIFDKLLKNVPVSLPLTDALIPGLQAFLEKSNLQQVWPDLASSSKIIGGSLQAFIEIPDGMQVQFDQQNNVAMLDVKKLKFKVKVQTHEGWKDYYIVHVDQQHKILLSVANNTLGFSLKEGSVKLGGEWAKESLAENREANLQVFSELFRDILTYLTQSNKTLSFQLPKVKLGQDKMGIISHHLENAYLDLDLGLTKE